MADNKQTVEPPKTAPESKPTTDSGTPKTTELKNGSLHPANFPDILVQPLLDMGFSRNRAIRGLHFTGGKSVDAAMNWVWENENDATIDLPLDTTPSSSSAVSSASARSLVNDVLESSDAVGIAHKMVLVVNMDLHMRTGKIAAQCAHAAVGVYGHLIRKKPQQLEPWASQGQAKIALRAPNLAELHALEKKARGVGLPTYIVQDAGRTQVDPGSETVLAIGPGPVDVIDGITGHLKLL